MKQYKLSPPKISLRSVFGAAAPAAPDPAPLPTNPETATEPPAEKTRRPPVLSLRLSAEERVRLERDAAGMSLSAYARERLFGLDTKPCRTRGKFPVKDHAKLATVLSALGRSNLARDFDALDVAVHNGTVHLTPESNRAFQRACADISAMRRDLLAALGMTAGPS